MNKRLAEKTAAAVALSRTILANSAAGLITATLIGFWSPMLKQSAPETQTQTPGQNLGRINVDPVSGKILDRIEGAQIEEAREVERPAFRLKPVLVGYALPALTDETEAESAPPTPRKPRDVTAAKAQTGGQADARIGAQPAPRATRPSAAAPESRNMPEEAPVAAAPAQTAEGEGWMSKFSPGALSAKIAPIAGKIASPVKLTGQAASYVSDGVAAAKRAAAERLEAFGF